MSDSTTVDLLTKCFDSIDGLLDGLSDEQWDTQSLCPAWTIRGVVTHLGAIEHMLVGLDPGALADGVPFARAGEWMKSVEQLSSADLLARYREVIAQRRVELAALTPDDLNREGMTPVGPGIESTARSRPSAIPCQFLSTRRANAASRSRWRVSAGRSIASKGPPPS